MKDIILPFLVFIGMSSLLLAAEPHPDIQRILKERYNGKYALILDGLVRIKPSQEELLRWDSNPSLCERYYVPSEEGMQDAFQYAIFRFKATGIVWIYKFGGFAGVSEFYVEPKQKNAEQGAAANP